MNVETTESVEAFVEDGRQVVGAVLKEGHIPTSPGNPRVTGMTVSNDQRSVLLETDMSAAFTTEYSRRHGIRNRVGHVPLDGECR